MKKKLLVLALLSIGSAFAQISFGIQIGPPPQPRIMRVRPVAPGQGYSWVDGYYYPVNNRYVWHNGYWTRPPYGGAAWVSPRYEGGEFYNGYWNGNGQDRYEHSHEWDRDSRNRDYDRKDKPGKGKGRGRGHDRDDH